MMRHKRFMGTNVALLAGGFSGWTFRASATSTGASITIPAGAAIGDLAILFQGSAASVSNTDVTPTDWTKLVNMSSGDSGTPVSRINTSYKILVSGDPGLSITGMDSDTDDSKVMLVFGASVATVTPSLTNTSVSSADPTALSIAASGAATPLVFVGASYCGNAAGAFSSESPAFTATVLGGQMRAGYVIYNTSPSDHTFDMNDLGSRNYLIGGVFTGA